MLNRNSFRSPLVAAALGALALMVGCREPDGTEGATEHENPTGQALPAATPQQVALPDVDMPGPQPTPQYRSQALALAPYGLTATMLVAKGVTASQVGDAIEVNGVNGRFHVRIREGATDFAKLRVQYESIPGFRRLEMDSDNSLMASRLGDNVVLAEFAYNITIARTDYTCESLVPDATLLEALYMLNACEQLVPGTVVRPVEEGTLAGQ